MRYAFLGVAFALAIAGPVLGQPKVQFVGTSIILTDQGRRTELREMIDSHSFHETLHAVHRRGNNYFIVYGSSEMSRGWPPKNGHCGAGIESFIRWLHIVDGKVVSSQEGLYESCFRNRDGWSIAWVNHKLTWSTGGLRQREGQQPSFEAIDLKWTYDPAHPELGLSESQQKSEWQPKTSH